MRPKRLNFVAMSFIAFAAVSVLGAGTLGGFATANASSAPVTLNLAEATTDQPGWNIVVADFAKVDPNIHLNINYLPGGSAFTGLVNTQLAGGNGPDMFRARVGSGQTGSVTLYAQQGIIKSLAGQPWTGSTYQAVQGYIKYKGSTYGLPQEVTVQGIWYNVSEFKKHGFKIPTRFSQLLALCGQVKSAGFTPISWGGGDSSITAPYVLALADQDVYSTDPNWNQQRASGSTTFSNSPGWQNTLQGVQDMINAGCFGNNNATAAAAQTDAIASFASQQSLMTFETSGFGGQIAALQPKFNLGIFTYPAAKAANSVIPLSVSVAQVVNAKTKYFQAAKTLLDFIATKKISRGFNNAVGAMSPLDVSQGHVSGYEKPFGPMLKAGKGIVNPSNAWPNANINTTLGKDISGMLIGKKTVSNVLADMDAAW